MSEPSSNAHMREAHLSRAGPIPQGGLVADSSLNESLDASQHTGGGGNTSLVSNSRRSAKDYLSDRNNDDRRVFRLILRSNENNAQNLRSFLVKSQSSLDLTGIFDRQGYSTLSYAIFKERP